MKYINIMIKKVEMKFNFLNYQKIYFYFNCYFILQNGIYESKMANFAYHSL